MSRRQPAPARRPTAAEQDEIVRLREEQGLKVGQIAHRLGFTKSTVTHHLLRAGLDPFEGKRTGPGYGRFSPAEDAQLLDLARRCLSKERIARTMNRPRTSVFMRLMLLEARAEAQMEKAA